MKIEKIITLTSADDWNRLRFLAMERSLRAVGCDLPLWVIPFDEKRFDLPENAIWVMDENLFKWLNANSAHPLTRKYICLLYANYHFVDTDIIFLKNPQQVLKEYKGFITSCGHWNNPHNQTYTNQSLQLLKSKSSLWQKNVFNSGQFACDIALYTHHSLYWNLSVGEIS